MVEKLKCIVKTELRTKIRNKNAVSPIRNLIVAYQAMLYNHMFRFVIEKNSKLSVRHGTSAVRSKALQKRLGSDLSF